MKCHKCGYTSFDYLSECKKCGVDLTSVRDGLGFWAVKPTVPFFLGLLLKDQAGGVTPGREALMGETPAETLPEIEFDDNFDMEEDFVLSGELTGGAEPSSEQSHDKVTLGPTGKDAGVTDEVLEISDEELNQFMEEAGQGKAPEMEPMLSAEVPTSSHRELPDVGEKTHAIPSLGGELGVQEELLDSFGVGLLDSDMDEFALDMKLEETDPGHNGDGRDKVPSWTDVDKPHKKAHADTVDESLVLELSEDDLENILMELEKAPAGEDDTVGDKSNITAGSELK